MMKRNDFSALKNLRYFYIKKRNAQRSSVNIVYTLFLFFNLNKKLYLFKRLKMGLKFSSNYQDRAGGFNVPLYTLEEN